MEVYLIYRKSVIIKVVYQKDEIFSEENKFTVIMFLDLTFVNFKPHTCLQPGVNTTVTPSSTFT